METDKQPLEKQKQQLVRRVRELSPEDMRFILRMARVLAEEQKKETRPFKTRNVPFGPGNYRAKLG